MISFLILMIFVIGFAVGYFRGLALQAYFNVGTLIAYLIATLLYKKYAETFELWVPFPSATIDSKLRLLNQDIIFDLSEVFYAAFAFILIYFIVMIVIQVLGIFAYPLKQMTIYPQYNRWIAGALGVCEFYFATLLILSIAALIPVNSVQNILGDSILARAMILRTPIFSHDIFKSWVTQIIQQKPF